MVRTGPYGEALANIFGLDEAPTMRARVLRKVEVFATEICLPDPRRGPTLEIAREDAYVIGVLLREYPRHVYWQDGRQAPLVDLKTGQTVLHDLKRSPVLNVDKPLHAINFYVPRAAFDAIADDADAPRIGELQYVPGAGVTDNTIFALTQSIQSAFAHPERAGQLFVDHAVTALATHVAQTYGGLKPVSRPPRGGLAPWQMRRAEEVLNARLDGSVTVPQVARECRLSASHFSRAFRISTGLAPHAWQTRRRIEAARSLLSSQKLSLSEVALACGFADQSHFTRVFTRHVGMSPGAWRRSVGS
jgi:AraC family transcriptional regulator